MTDERIMREHIASEIARIDSKIAHIKIIISLANTNTEVGLNKYIQAAEQHGFLQGQRSVLKGLTDPPGKEGVRNGN